MDSIVIFLSLEDCVNFQASMLMLIIRSEMMTVRRQRTSNIYFIASKNPRMRRTSKYMNILQI